MRSSPAFRVAHIYSKEELHMRHTYPGAHAAIELQPGTAFSSHFGPFAKSKCPVYGFSSTKGDIDSASSPSICQTFGVGRSHGMHGYNPDLPEMDGVFIMKGPRVRSPGRTVTGVRLVDIAPTIAYLLGLGSLPDPDGRVLQELLSPQNSDLASSSSIRRKPVSNHRYFMDSILSDLKRDVKSRESLQPHAFLPPGFPSWQGPTEGTARKREMTDPIIVPAGTLKRK